MPSNFSEKKNRFKQYLFECASIFEFSQSHSPFLLIALLCLQLVVTQYLYINPIYPWLADSPILSSYFADVFRSLFFAHHSYPYSQGALDSELAVTEVPFGLIAISASTIVIALAGVFKSVSEKHILTFIVCLFLRLCPILVPRVACELFSLLRLFQSEVSIVVPVLFVLPCLIGLIMLTIVLIYEERIITKCLELLVVILMCFEVRWEVIAALLGLKLMLGLWKDHSCGRNIKLGYEISLYVSLLILMRATHSSINFIVIGSVTGLITLCPTYDLYIQLITKNSKVISKEKDAGLNSSSKFTYDDLLYIKRVNRHLRDCELIDCFCHSFEEVKSPVELQKWAWEFQKDFQRQKKDFTGAVEYAELCLKEQQMDITGLLKILKKKPQNYRQKYYKYKLMKSYKNLIQDSQINFIKDRQHTGFKKNQFEPSTQILYLQSRIGNIIQKLINFWKKILKCQEKSFLITLIQQISRQISQLNEYYEKFNETNEENIQFQELYKIFEILVLNQTEQQNKITISQDNYQKIYFMLTDGNQISNISYNMTLLLKKQKVKIISSVYQKYMLKDHQNYHQQWVNQFLNGYKPSLKKQFIKPIFIEGLKMHVLEMQHIYVPIASQKVCIMTCSRQIHINKNEDTHRKKKSNKIFHILVGKIGLDIIAFEQKMLQYFKIQQNQKIITKLSKSTLTDIFPNINQECLNKIKINSSKIISKPQFSFFNVTKGTIYENNTLIKQEKTFINKEDDEFQFQATEIFLPKTQQLGYKLIRFQNCRDISFEQSNQYDYVHSQKQITNIKKVIDQFDDNQQTDEQQTEQRLFRYKILLACTCLCFYTLFLITFLSADSFKTELKVVNNDIKNMSKFLQRVVETTLFYSDIPIGQNEVQKIREQLIQQQYYSQILTTFQQINNEVYQARNLQAQILDRQKQLQTDLNNKINYFQQQISNKETISIILFCFIFLLIGANYIINCIMFSSSEQKASSTMQSFFYLNKKQIKRTISQLRSSQKIFGLKNYDPINISYKENNNNLFMSSIKGEEQNSAFNLMKTEENQMNTVDNNLYNKMRLTTQDQHHQEQVIKNIFMPQIDDQIENINNFKSQQNIQDKLISNFFKNFRYFAPGCISFILMLVVVIFAFLLEIIYLSQQLQSTKYQINLSWEPIFLLLKIEELYFNVSLTGNTTLNELYYSNFLELSKLPADFEEFVSFENHISTDNLCNLEMSQDLVRACTEKQYLFEAGQAPALQFISEYLRRIKKGEIESERLIQQNQFSIAVKVMREMYEIRNNRYYQIFGQFQIRYEQLYQLNQVIAFIVIVGCLYLQIKSIQNTEERTMKAKNLFKILPKKLKNSIQTNNNYQNKNKDPEPIRQDSIKIDVNEKQIIKRYESI